jgi:hypothetical protein
MYEGIVSEISQLAYGTVRTGWDSGCESQIMTILLRNRNSRSNKLLRLFRLSLSLLTTGTSLHIFDMTKETREIHNICI